ncbi:MAG: MBG domain-containing protein, partial [Clostridia bacterium]|nr:MBG domain-containing protein [Clostridia bacterium]
KDVTFKIKDTDAEADYEITINQGTLTPTVTFKDLTVTYDGTAKKIEATVTGLPEGVTLVPAYTVTGSAITYNAAGYVNAGTYNYSVTFTHTDGNYAQYITPSTATLQIDKATYTMPTGYDETKQVTYTGSAISLPANWITGLDPDVTVAYYEADGTTPFAAKTTIAKYTVKAGFSVADPANYEVPAPVTLTFEITDKKTFKPAVTFKDGTFTYDGQPHVIAIDGEVPDWIIVTYYKADGTTVFTGATDVADSGKVIARFTHNDPEYATIPDMTATITIEKAKVDMSGVKFEKVTVTGNGQPHKFEATNLPEGVTVEYEYDGKKQATPFEFTEVGGYTVKAYFTYEDEDNYEEIKPIEATLTVSDAVVTEIKAELSGKEYTTANT